MIVLLDTSHDLATAEREIGLPVGQLITPLTRRAYRGDPFAIDNGAFSKSRFDAERFLSLVRRHEDRRDKCLFVAVPDVVGSARRTLETFRHWYPRLERWPLALVAQDGIEDLEIPWRHIRAVFIGGSTRFKMSDAAEAVIRASQMIGCWVHVGRVNTPDRIEKFLDLEVDSVDGTGIGRYSWMRERIAGHLGQQRLFEQSASEGASPR